ncbi:MAG: hypothetical protein HRU09_15355, partial [Oligoflexales bacterium]|nr:hypothetical protein [Oligoflexales bacterium]
MPKGQKPPPVVGYVKRPERDLYTPVYKLESREPTSAVADIQKVLEATKQKNSLSFKIDGVETPASATKTTAQPFVKAVDDYLTQAGFLRLDGGFYYRSLPRVELPKDSPLDAVQATRGYDSSTQARNAALYDFDDTLTKVTPNKYSTHYSCVIRTLYFGRNG